MMFPDRRSSFAGWKIQRAKPASKLFGQFPVSIPSRVLAAPKKLAYFGLPFDRPKSQKDFIHFRRPFEAYWAIFCVR
jgi:hypothetical protein